MKPSRYKNLFTEIYNNRCRSILEIGVYNGTRAWQMIRVASLFNSAETIEYYGFDLFEMLTDEDLKNELSKRPPCMEVVRRKISRTGAKVELNQGYTKDTLPGFVEQYAGTKQFDFIFIDGGHSLESIQGDWDAVSQLMGPETVVMFDDYYRNDESEIEGFGCQRIIDCLDLNKYDVDVLGPENRFPKEWGYLNVSMARVRLKK